MPENPDPLQPSPAGTSVKVMRVTQDSVTFHDDTVATEEPLEIQLSYLRLKNRVSKSVSITMRTPGHDRELALGFLYSEGIIRSAAEVENFSTPVRQIGQSLAGQTITVELVDGVSVDLQQLERNFYVTSSCGVCGKATIKALERRGIPVMREENKISARAILRLPERLRGAQSIFDKTGGLHAAGLFDADGELLSIFEDVGRHNALDKLIGDALLRRPPSLSKYMVCLSGRTSFELVQKAAVAGFPILAAVGAPSSLAVQVARHFGMTLLGFVGPNRFNAYAGGGRIDMSPVTAAP